MPQMIALLRRGMPEGVWERIRWVCDLRVAGRRWSPGCPHRCTCTAASRRSVRRGRRPSRTSNCMPSYWAPRRCAAWKQSEMRLGASPSSWRPSGRARRTAAQHAEAWHFRPASGVPCPRTAHCLLSPFPDLRARTAQRSHSRPINP
jgi:hypothetical protein